MSEEEDVIKFFGFNHPLSNFYESPFRIGDIIYPTVEHYFQSNKTDSPDESFEILMADTPKKAKLLGRYVEYLKDGWDIRRNKYMYDGVRAKFSQNPKLKQYLLETGEKRLVENSIYDEYWGIGRTGDGRNMAGKILMKVREDLKEV